MREQVELTFARVENPERKVKLTAYLDDEIAYYAILAAKRLGLRPDEEFGLFTPSGIPVKHASSATVRGVISKYGTTSFHIVSADSPAVA